jgi:hypothetical protein
MELTGNIESMVYLEERGKATLYFWRRVCGERVCVERRCVWRGVGVGVGVLSDSEIWG